MNNTVANFDFKENENPNFIDMCSVNEKYGVYIKGKDVVFLDAPEICFVNSDIVNDGTADTELKIILYGDGLCWFGGDLFCAYPLLSTEITDASVVFEYEKYTVTVSWENDTETNNKRINPKWKREYKENKDTESEV